MSSLRLLNIGARGRSSTAAWITSIRSFYSCCPRATIQGQIGLPDDPKPSPFKLRGNPRPLLHHFSTSNMAPSLANRTSSGSENITVEQRTANLARFCSELQFKDIPSDVVERTKSFYLDTIACAVAGQEHQAVKAMMSFAKQMGPNDGSCEYWFTNASRTSAAFAALVNGAASHVVEQDDLNNLGMIHSATVVFPAAAAAAQDVGCSGEEFITACVAGYEAACRIGEYLGKKHYNLFHTTATAGTFGATAAVARILKLEFEKTLWAFGTAGTQAAGLWQYLREATHSKQVHTGKACFNGLISAYTARDGLTGPKDILGGVKGMAASMAGEVFPTALDEDLGKRYTVMETSFKWHASCRHTHPSVDGLLELMEKNNLKREDIAKVKCGVYQATLDILNPGMPESVHHSKFSMGYVLGVAAKFGHAAINDFNENTLKQSDILDFIDKVEMYLDKEVDDAFPRDWMARVKITTKDGKTYEKLVESPKGDPDFTLTRHEIEFKARALFDYSGWKDKPAQDKLIKKVWGLEKEKKIDFWS